ncbi:MAG: Serine/threonine protein kinase [Frankiales bacterium]|nr:Serine/threonine protein kinase [Frankiales bacterium]
MSTRRALLFSCLLTAGLAHSPAQENATPAASAEPPQTEMRNWIATTDAQWQAVFKRDVTDVHEVELGKLKLQYRTSLESAIARASGASDLNGALALRDEQKRFADSNVIPEQDEAGVAASVKQLRAAVRVPLARVEKDYAARAKALHAKYDQALAQAQAQLTQRRRLDDAVLVQKKREEVAAAWITPAVLSAEKATPPTPPLAGSASTPAAVTPQPIAATPTVKGAFDAQLTKLTRAAWTWETVMGKGTIKFAKDGTCVHTRFNGTFEIQKDDTVVVHMPTRKEVLVFDFGKGEFTGYDEVLKQKITGRRTYQK